MALITFLDTSVLLAGLIDLGPQSAPAQSIMHGVAEKTIPSAATAWHCCLEFYSVATRLPPEYRLVPADACRLLEDEVFARLAVHDCGRRPSRVPSHRRPRRDRGRTGVRRPHRRSGARGRRDGCRHRQSPSLHGRPPVRDSRGDAGEFLAGRKEKR